MTTENEARLRKLLKACKITQEEYDELRENLPEEPAAPPDSPPPPPVTCRAEAGATFWTRSRPWQVWFCAVCLFLFSFFSLFAADSKGMLGILTAGAFLNVGLGFGLLARWRWVYEATFISATIAVLFTVPNVCENLFLEFLLALAILAFMIVLASAQSHFPTTVWIIRLKSIWKG